jgi:hypothetical protein
LNLLVAAIILWNTVYLQRGFDYLRSQSDEPTPSDLAYLSPLGWEHQSHGRLSLGNIAELRPGSISTASRPSPKALPPPLSVLKIPFRVFSITCSIRCQHRKDVMVEAMEGASIRFCKWQNRRVGARP